MRALSLIITVIAVLIANGCTSSKDSLVYSSHVWPGYEFVFLGKHLGWLNEEKVTVVETSSATDSIDLLAKRKVDAAALTLDEVILARSKGIPLTVVAVFDVSAGADMFISKRHVELKEIKGHRIGVETTAVGSMVLSHLLDNAGLKHSEITIVHLTIDEQVDAWINDEIDSVITYEPVAHKLLNLGGHKLFDSRDMPETIFDVLAVHQSALDKSKQIRHLLDIHFDALHHFETHQEDALYRMSSRLDVFPNQVFNLYEGLVLPNLNTNKRLLNHENSKIIEAARSLSNLMLKNGIINQKVSMDDFIDNSYL